MPRSLDNSKDVTPVARPTARRAVFGLFLPSLLVCVVAGLAVAWLVHGKRRSLSAETRVRANEVQAGPRVQVVTVGTSPPHQVLTLLGETRPFISATVYAKVAGYLKDVRVDKGDRVTENEILSVVESPETDQQYLSAVADAHNKHLIAERYAILVKTQAISQQDADQAEADAKVADATVAQDAALKSYEILRAPFDGVVTARFADPGALVQAATSAQTSSLPVVTVSKIDVLRTYVYVPQEDASFVHVGDPVTISLPYLAGVKITARVTRDADELDPQTRTLLTEIDFENRGRPVIPGSFVNVSITLRARPYLDVPSEALIFRGQQAGVAIVRPDNTVQFRPVTVADDDGQQARIISGLVRGERVALNLGPTVADGGKIQPVEAHGSGGRD